MGEETIEIPKKQWYQIGDFFTRQDEIQEAILKVTKRQLEVLKALEAISPPAIPPPEIQPPPIIGSFEIGSIHPSVLAFLAKNPLPVIAYPTGEIRRKGTLAALTTSYETLVKYKPAKEMVFGLCKITVSCSEDVITQLFWGDKEISIPYYMFQDFPLVEFFPVLCRTYKGEKIVGDGTRELLLKVKMPSGGTSVEVNGEIAGDER